MFSFASCVTNETYTVSFDVNGGVMPNGASNRVAVSSGDTVPLPLPVKEGHSFAGWYTGDSAVDGRFISSDGVFSNLELVARWNPNKVTVSFYDHNGILLGSDTVDYGKSATAPEIPQFANGKKLVFDKWDSDFSSVKSDMTVKAVYVANVYNLSFVTNCDASIDDVSIAYGDIADIPDELEKDGYTFGGWYLDDSFKQRYYFNYPLNEDAVIYAFFYPNTNGEYTLITMPEDLANMANNPAGKYLLARDIDFEGQIFNPISEFSGELNGNGYTISNIIINGTSAGVGFIVNNTGLIKDLSFDGVSFSISSGNKNNYYGVICAENNGTVDNCHLLGGSISISCHYDLYSGNSVTDYVRIGSLVGLNKGNITYCSNSVDMTVSVSSFIDTKETLYRHPYVGGLVGHNDKNASIVGCVNKGNINSSFEVDRWSSNSTNSDMQPRVGGLVGVNHGTVDQSVSSSAITYSSKMTSGRIYSRMGGFVGQNYGTVTNSYSEGKVTRLGSSDTAYAGGFVGINNGTVKNCYSTASISDEATDSANGLGGFAGLNETVSGYTCLISDSFSTGNVNMLKKAEYFGCFVGKINSNAPFFRCYYVNSAAVVFGEENVTPESNVSEPASIDDLTSARFLCEILYFDNGIWRFAEGEFPTLLSIN